MSFNLSVLSEVQMKSRLIIASLITAATLAACSSPTVLNLEEFGAQPTLEELNADNESGLELAGKPAGLGNLLVRKVYDTNQNGKRDEEEPGIPDWGVRIVSVDENGNPDDAADIQVTPQGGQRWRGVSLKVPYGKYKIEELEPTGTKQAGTGWKVTGPTSKIVNVSREKSVRAIEFAGICLENGVLVKFPKIADFGAWKCRATFDLLPRIGSFTATPVQIQTGGSSALAWNVLDYSKLEITPTVGVVTGFTGSRSVTPTSTTAYTLKATNGFGSRTANATVNVQSVQPIIWTDSKTILEDPQRIDTGTGIATDQQGNLFVTANNVRYDPQTFVKTASSAIVTKLDANGSIVWQKHLGDDTFDANGLGAGNTIGRVSTDTAGNALVIGVSYQNSAGAPVPIRTAQDAFLAKYNPAGTLLWKTKLTASTDDAPVDLGTDAQGNVYVVGNACGFGKTFYGSVVTGNVTLGGVLTDCNPFLVKFNSSGAVVSTRLDTTEAGTALGVAVAANGTVVTGSSRLKITDATTSPVTFTNRSYMRRFDAAGTLTWERVVGTDPNFAFLEAVTVDEAGNTYAGGVGFPDATRIPNNGYSAFIQKYDATGAVKWTKLFASDPTGCTQTFCGKARVFALRVFAGNLYINGETYAPFSDTANFTTPFKFDLNGNYVGKSGGVLPANDAASTFVVKRPGEFTVNTNGVFVLSSRFAPLGSMPNSDLVTVSQLSLNFTP
jgi:hypothetical protein